uniref:Protein phosphatase inhibitor 2 n=2 Tax=Aplanochytrium stocchinoi TaxID=215587 RepID=A0A6S8EI81_9STRA|mmetsp:Transcript_15187/g.17878  ORF Transcript_15187/g.17878 Transcript_15187/m.17878 type:complete len:179 (-) Transcript_15187:1464-2000(-)
MKSGNASSKSAASTADVHKNVKPILRTTKTEDKKCEQKPKLSIRFDEEVIAEHDKLRGTRQKIDEPKTPYRRGSFDEEYGDIPEAIANAQPKESTTSPRDPESNHVQLGNAAMVDFAGALSSRLKEVNDQSSEPTAASAAERKDFEERRKRHYNEFQMMKKWRETHKDGDETKTKSSS